MKATRQDLIDAHNEASKQLTLHQLYLYHAFRSEVTFFFKGNYKVGVCGECRASGGIVIEAIKESAGKWYVIGISYFDHALAQVNAPEAFATEDLMTRRTLYGAVQKHVREVQAKTFNTVTA